jgi:acyl carrier protein
LGEIEAVLRQHPAVQDTVVVLREDMLGDKRLVAYLVPTRPQLPTVSELRSFLQSKLPDYMVPAAFMFLDTLPFTPNGKIDRRGLPVPEPMRQELERVFVAPRTPEEEIIAGVWQEVLGRECVGIHDNFFELGGHSLKATQVVARIRAALQIELPLRTLFEAPTVAGLVSVIARSQEQSSVQAELAQFVTEVENLSDEEAQQMLSQMQPKTIQ